MTAANAFVGQSAAYLITDAGAFLPDGTIMQIGSKVITSDRLKIAVASAGRGVIYVDESGIHSPLPALRDLLDQCGTAGEFLGKLPSFLFSVELEPGGYMQCTIALWNSADRQAEAYVIGTPGHTFSGLAPFTVAGVGAVTMPKLDDSCWPDGKDLTRRGALGIIKAQRRSREPDGSIHVGGFAELTTVSEKGVSIERLLTWPDRVGQKVRPHRGTLLQRFFSAPRLGKNPHLSAAGWS